MNSNNSTNLKTCPTQISTADDSKRQCLEIPTLRTRHRFAPILDLQTAHENENKNALIFRILQCLDLTVLSCIPSDMKLSFALL